MSERVGKMLRNEPQMKRQWPKLSGRQPGKLAAILRENRQTLIMDRAIRKARESA